MQPCERFISFGRVSRTWVHLIVWGLNDYCWQNWSSLFPVGVTELPQSGLFAYAHIEDVAGVHVSALESTEASGRYICYESVVSEEKLVELIRKFYPDSSIPSRYFTTQYVSLASLVRPLFYTLEIYGLQILLTRLHVLPFIILDTSIYHW